MLVVLVRLTALPSMPAPVEALNVLRTEGTPQ